MCVVAPTVILEEHGERTGQGGKSTMRRSILCAVLLLALPILACSFSFDTGGDAEEPTVAPPGDEIPTMAAPTSAEPRLYGVFFASSITPDEEPIDVAAAFSLGVSSVYAFASHEGMSDGADCESVWYLDGEEAVRTPFVWNAGASGGPLMVAYVESEGGLPAGGYQWELYADGQLVATANFSVSGQAPSSVLWEDDFSDPASGWSTGSFPSGEVRYEGGELRIRNYTAADLTTYSLPDLRFSDLVMEVESRLVDGSQDNWHFHVCRWVDLENFYLFGYSADGYYIALATIGGQQITHVPSTSSQAIRQGVGAVNVVRVECVGDQLRFWVNGELLVDIVDHSLTDGDIGLGEASLGGEYSDVAFDNLVIRAPETR
jgi:hypothetical protein